MTNLRLGDGNVLQIRGNLELVYADVYTREALAALVALAPLEEARRALMTARLERRAARARERQPIAFLDPDSKIAGTSLTVRDARAASVSTSGFRFCPRTPRSAEPA